MSLIYGLTTTDEGTGSKVPVLVDSAGNPQVDIVSMPSGASSSAVQGAVAHDAAAASINPVLVGGYGSAAAPSDVSTTTDSVRAWFQLNGSACVTMTAAGALIGGDAANGLDVDVTRVIPGTSATHLGKARDGASAATDTGVAIMTIRDDALSSVTPIEGDYEVLRTDANGALHMNMSYKLDSTNDSITAHGPAAHDAAVSGNPLACAGVASAAAPTDVNADQDVVRSWHLRNGAQCINVTSAGALIGGDATNGLDVDVTRMAALVAGTANIGDVDVLTTAIGTTKNPTITITDTPDYSAGDDVGGIISITTVNSASGRPVLLKSVTAKDDGNIGPALTLMFFKATPAAGTYTDNAALVIDASDLADLVGVVRILATDWLTVASKKMVSFGGIEQLLDVDATTLFTLISADAAWNVASTSDLTIEFGFEQK